MAIGATAHKLILDSTQFVNGAMLSRKELNFLKQTLRETATDADKFGAGLDQLSSLQKKGALTTEQYEKAIQNLHSEFTDGGSVLDGWIGKLTPTIDIANVASRAFGMMSSAAHLVIDTVKDQLENMDKLIASSDKLGISAEAFQNIGTGAKFADIEVSSASNAMERMLTAISKGEDGAKKFADTFRMLGLNAAELQQMRPDQALGRILDALNGIDNQADWVR